MSLIAVIGVVLVILKLVGTITLSWWLVLLPFYAGLVIALALFTLTAVVGSVAAAAVRKTGPPKPKPRYRSR